MVYDLALAMQKPIFRGVGGGGGGGVINITTDINLKKLVLIKHFFVYLSEKQISQIAEVK